VQSHVTLPAADEKCIRNSWLLNFTLTAFATPTALLELVAACGERNGQTRRLATASRGKLAKHLRLLKTGVSVFRIHIQRHTPIATQATCAFAAVIKISSKLIGRLSSFSPHATTCFKKRKRSAGNQDRSQIPRQRAQVNSTWPDAPCGAWGPSTASLVKGPMAQAGDFLGSRTLTLTRRSNCLQRPSSGRFLSLHYVSIAN